MILLTYDGSADAQAAIDNVARLMPAATTTVLTVWVPFTDALARTATPAMGIGTGMYADAEGIDEANRAAAFATADEGARRATAAGLVARPRAQVCEGGVATTIADVAAELECDAIVVGTRGLSGVKSFLLGSVSHAVVQHADRAVLVIPSPPLAQRRRRQAGRDAAPA